MAWRGTSLSAMLWAETRAVEASTIALRTRPGCDTVHCNACMPPMLPPVTHSHWSMPR